MQALLEAFRAALASLAAHRMRSFLTTLGILIGTGSVIAVVALVQGFSDSIKGQLSDLGGSTLTLRAVNDNENFRTGKLNTISFNDIRVLRYRVAGVKDVAPLMVVQAAGASYKGRTSSPQVQATTADYALVNGRFPAFGRFIVDSDDRGHRRVAIIGADLRDELKMPKNPVGEYFQIGSEWFKVVGVMEKEGELFGFSRDNYAIIPFDVGRAMMGNSNDPMIMASFTVANLAEVETVRERVKRAVRASRRLASEDDDDFKVEAADSVLKQFEKITGTATLVVAGVVGISLLVGGIGIMNIMLVSVTERIREIGLRMAVGAGPSDVRRQFLAEAMLLSLGGGVLGIVIGIVGALLVGKFSELPVALNGQVIGLAAGFSIATGLFFGYYPARKASQLDPIEALRSQ